MLRVLVIYCLHANWKKKKRKKTHRTKITHLLHAKLQFTAFPFQFELTVLWETEMISSETNEIHRKVCQQTEASASLN